MKRLTATGLACACLAACLSVLPSTAALLSKTFVFQPGATLDVGADVEPGVRIDTVRFLLPASDENGIQRTSGHVQAEVAISNTGTTSRRIGIALALFDEAGRLLAVASGGDTVFPLKAARQGVYTLTFDRVNAEAAATTRFQISVETR